MKAIKKGSSKTDTFEEIDMSDWIKINSHLTSLPLSNISLASLTLVAKNVDPPLSGWFKNISFLWAYMIFVG